MKKISVILLALLMFLTLELKTALAEVILFFDFRNASEAYITFTYDFGEQFLSQAKKHRFAGRYVIKVLQGKGRIKNESGEVQEEKQAGIVILINDEEISETYVKLKDLTTTQKIKQKAKEFSEEVIKKLKKLEKKKETEEKAKAKIAV